MGFLKKWSRLTFRKDILATILVAILTFASGTALLPKTPKGTSCPKVAVCAGHSHEFRQCLCADESSHTSSTKGASVVVVEYPIPLSCFGGFPIQGVSQVLVDRSESFTELQNPSPATPPPDQFL